MLSHKPIANEKYEFEYIFAIDLPIGWGLDGTILEYVTLGFRWQGLKARASKAGSIPIVLKCGP